ncbi:hypothetical protein BHM03_00026395 [Ensete ventricosum]|nr:hypothetical protein BHM03_00026395 [Ensete ventricosum]
MSLPPATAISWFPLYYNHLHAANPSAAALPRIAALPLLPPSHRLLCVVVAQPPLLLIAATHLCTAPIVGCCLLLPIVVVLSLLTASISSMKRTLSLPSSSHITRYLLPLASPTSPATYCLCPLPHHPLLPLHSCNIGRPCCCC